MGGSSSKTTFFRQKRKKSRLDNAWSQLRGALPNKKRRKKSVLPLDNLRTKNSQKRFSLPTDKKEPTSLKRFSLGNIRKESESGKKEKDGGGLGKAGEQIKRKFSLEPKKRLSVHQEAAAPSVKLRERKGENEANGPESGAKVSKKKLGEIMRSIRPAGSKANE